jgi:signal transduction histidine kinase/ActR/RegA family two-component response regulator
LTIWTEAVGASLPLIFFLLALGGGGLMYLRQRHYDELAATEAALVLERDKLQEMVSEKTRDLANAKEAAEAGAQAKASFLANMSHEIRTPLNAVLGFAQIGQRDSKEQLSLVCFHRIMKSGELLLRVLDDVLDLSAIDAGKLTLQVAPFSLLSMVEDTMDMVIEQARSKSLALTAQMDSSMPDWVDGDRVRLQQILLKLLSNAIKFTDYGSVTVSASWLAGCAVLEVADTGIGLADQDVSQLFKPFEKADSSMRRRHGGTGLGLSIANSLAQIMGGSISVSSQRGRGSRFCVRVPLPAVENPAVLHPEKRYRADNRLSGLKILVADDDLINRNLLEYLLSREGAQVVFAENGLQVLDEIRNEGADAFDLVLMDIQMPVMDGYEATQKIREITPLLPVVGLTAHALPEEGQKCLRAGMAAYLAKPCDVEDLVSAIEKFSTPPAPTQGSGDG